MSGKHERQRVAVVGSGVSGLTAAYVLRKSHAVTVFESDNRMGGHAHTHTVEDPGATHRVDSGFIVHNDRTYPWLRKLFGELDVEVHATEMSMSIRCEECGLEYAGGRSAKGIFAQRRRMFDPRYLQMLLAIKRFQRLADALLDTEADPQEGKARRPTATSCANTNSPTISSRTMQSRSCPACGLRVTRRRWNIRRAISSSS